MFSRRQVLLASGGLGLAALVAGVLPKLSTGTALVSEAHADEAFEVSHSDSEWHSILSDEQYRILRKEGTERAYTSPSTMNIARAHSPVPGVIWRCFHPPPNSTAAPDGRVSGRRWSTPWPRVRTAPSACPAKRFTVVAAADIWGMSSMTDRSPPACVIA